MDNSLGVFNITNPSVKYSDAENEFVDTDELIAHPEKYLILGLSSHFNCRGCRKRMSIKKSKKCITLLCGCGCRVIYPPNANGDFVTNWIPKDKHKEGHHG